jgi:phenylpyruvate tautomerase PptA (4-oxalocrotonate tautomerase family)
MPNILVKIPHGSYPGTARQALARAITTVANDVEQVGDTLQHRAVTLVAIEELAAGAVTSGGHDISERALLCIVQAYIPAGVLDGASRAHYVARLDEAFKSTRPEGDTRQVYLSTLLLEVPEGQWGAGPVIWRLPDVSAAAGFKHLTSVARSC